MWNLPNGTMKSMGQMNGRFSTVSVEGQVNHRSTSQQVQSSMTAH
jgi:hypothetical protein